MKLLGSNAWRNYAIFRVLRARFWSTKVIEQSFALIEDNLYRRISGAEISSIVPVLKQWLEEGKEVEQSELRKFIKQLRKYRRFRHALQISEWMSDQRNHVLSTGDIAIRLDLISTVHGVEQVEKYFDSIPETMRTFQVYGALLSCYACNRSLEKAEATMQRMREFKLGKSSLTYNVMLNLYFRQGKHEKLDTLMQEMTEVGINWDNFTCNIRLNAYAASADVKGMEKLLIMMEVDPHLSMEWNTYVVAANGFLKSGHNEKALTMLKRAEELIHGNSSRLAYESIITLYAALGVKDEVYRLWNLYKNIGKVVNSGYLSMLSSLMKLDDIDCAERLLEEWESGTTIFDSRIPNLAIRAYCKKGLLEKAEAYFKRLMESGKKPDASTWECLATGYWINGQTAKAVETMKNAFLARQPGWKPKQYTLAACLKYMKGLGKEEEALAMLRSLKKGGHMSSQICAQLLHDNKNEILCSGPLDLMEGDDGEMKKVIEQSYAPFQDTLYSLISRARIRRAPIGAVLDQWLEEGKEVTQSQLQSFIKMLRKKRGFKHALEISNWMSDQRNCVLSIADVSVRLELISRVHSLEQAEKYFDSIPESMRIFPVYCSLLNCYAYTMSLEKAEATMKKMKELKFRNSSFPYNVMLNLYSRLGNHEKLDILMQEMKELGIMWDKFTYKIRLTAYVASSDVEQMEKLLIKMEADPLISMDWSSYSVVANGFLKSHLNEKALTILKRAEQLIYGESRRLAYENILTLYATCGVKDEVYRIWNLYKNIGKVSNSGYLSMLSSLVKLDDIDGAERLLEEWESGATIFDARIRNLMIRAYCKKGLLEKAVAYVERLMDSGKEPHASTWGSLATGYWINGQTSKAAETMKKAFMARRPGWKPCEYTLAACLKYMKGQGEEEEALEILRSLEKGGHISSQIYDQLLHDIKNEILCSGPLDPMEEEDGEMEKFIEVKDEDENSR
ncbi:pentatricopeptide repeat-containing protein [Tripterygium wilfordii]|uniref:Pentatricopeptide repeat-containing protein n=1 Tax=Tripterygium wilfordii TaxID=458696 RepID=A0A7J7BXW5_TRIWF|nr:pentatricopeptide repeat-containing protein At2g18940, chloroplastic-like [Tripterygium wilfordii]KAF5726386.1 pentatricopeptide repeat-containing protein [Tripterygium wilfordii]